ncbi:MAG: PASTA domain-containing protein [Brumimicrobium sp.]|nr:PASTA domain-containing protein [Brumimicrobium sp.]MCO5267699.1 PASTA domain-containing protein [Brumimicrobium sp.]
MGFFQKLSEVLMIKKILIHIALVILAWILIIFGSKLYFSGFTHHGETIDVPNFLNNNIKDVPKLIGDRELEYEILDSVYNPDLVAGTIIYQNPMPTDSSGVKVKQGRVITVRVSKRSRDVIVPDVISKSQRFAEAILLTKGLRTKVIYVPSFEDQGGVIDAKYKGKKITHGLKVPINSVIELTVGKKTLGALVDVPNLLGLTISEAEARFNGGTSLQLFSICSACQTKSDSLNAKIIRQTPIGGDSSKIPMGSTITVFLSPNAEDNND